jgi:hypothetical protein
MLTRIVCPNCGHIGATSATLPRILVCSQCGHPPPDAPAANLFIRDKALADRGEHRQAPGAVAAKANLAFKPKAIAATLAA